MLTLIAWREYPLLSWKIAINFRATAIPMATEWTKNNGPATARHFILSIQPESDSSSWKWYVQAELGAFETDNQVTNITVFLLLITRHCLLNLQTALRSAHFVQEIPSQLVMQIQISQGTNILSTLK